MAASSKSNSEEAKSGAATKSPGPQDVVSKSPGPQDMVSPGSQGCNGCNNTLRKSLIVLNVLVRVYTSLYMIIPDCDETFNYWDPLNLLVRGFGKQTWEYSPEYAIRSYAYLAPYYVINVPMQFFVKWTGSPSYWQFYWIRLVGINGVTCVGELALAASLDQNFGAKVGNWFLVLSSVSTGMSHAGVALLPSTFAMQMTIFATSKALSAIGAFSDTVKANNSVKALVWFATAGLMGWPFALALSVPFGAYTLVTAKTTTVLPSVVGKTLLKVLGLVLIIVGIDNIFYRKFSFVPLNIVLYNVFGAEGEGPEIFGVEPFTYYVANLLLNFNIVFVLGFLGALANGFLYEYKYTSKIWIGVTAPLLVWSGVFGVQPHKEERFLYPIYPLIVVSASLLINKIFTLVNTIRNKLRLPRQLTWLLKGSFGLVVSTVSLLRIFNLVENYSAPLTVSRALADHAASLPASAHLQNVCVGREWYHFPTSVFLPDNFRLRFVASGFDGLLPGDFIEDAAVPLSVITSAIPENMNNRNQFDSSKLIDFESCDYYFDNSQAIDLESGEPYMFVDGTNEVRPDWEVVSCEKLINPDGDHRGIGRLLYIPSALRIWVKNDVEYMDLCIFRKTHSHHEA